MMNAMLTVKTMPSREEEASLYLSTNDEGIHVILGERQVWIEVNEGGNLVARMYHDKTPDKYIVVTLTTEDMVQETIYEE